MRAFAVLAVLLFALVQASPSLARVYCEDGWPTNGCIPLPNDGLIIINPAPDPEPVKPKPKPKPKPSFTDSGHTPVFMQ